MTRTRVLFFESYLIPARIRITRRIDDYLFENTDEAHFNVGDEFDVHISVDGETALLDLGCGQRVKLFAFLNDYEELNVLDLMARALLPPDDPRHYDPDRSG